jgi:hypothetical protein
MLELVEPADGDKMLVYIEDVNLTLNELGILCLEPFPSQVTPLGPYSPSLESAVRG